MYVVLTQQLAHSVWHRLLLVDLASPTFTPASAASPPTRLVTWSGWSIELLHDTETHK
ncbi:hypothetical protein [Nocardia niwae]|uniref:Uncharacterized protein n=1 Tax=Nocardia niwae TaxID=626084 RepID=A0ABV2X7J6_9NOCA|nr:hypothetical protein [Nocardia niwae]